MLILVEEMFIETTYEKIFERISSPALEKADIRLGKRVVQVNTIGVNGKSGTVAVKTEDGEMVTFSGVLMTTPLGWLKLHKEAIEPPLPARISSAVDAISVGILEKV